jgi:hypothetical protein
MIKVIKDFLPIENFNLIKKNLFSNDFSWYYRESMTYENETNYKNFNWEKPYFFHFLFNENHTRSAYFPIIEKCISLLNAKALISIRCNLTLNYEKQYKCAWHKDQEYDCKTAILYMNTCNGYTEFKDKVKKIKSEENKIVIFDNKNIHRLVNQTDIKRRIVINFNYFD